MNQLNLFDFAALGFAGGSVLLACWRGLGREVLHTLFFAATLAAAYFFFKTQDAPATPADVVKMVLNFGYFSITAYLITWILMKFAAPIFLDSADVGLRSRFWAGLLALVKVAGIALALNLWYAMHSPDAHPQRLTILPQILRESEVVQVSDGYTELLYHWLAGQGWLTYQKYTERPLTPDEQNTIQDQKALGVR